MTIARARAQLLLASFAVLFQELTLIRALPGQVRVLGYFPNLILISAFLGLGLGALRSNRGSLLWLWPPSLLLVTAIGAAMSRVAITANTVSEHLWLLYFDLPEGAPVYDGIRLPIVLLFGLSAVTFIPLGQVIAERLSFFRRESAALWGYSYDLTGSLLGVVGFTMLSFLGVGPRIWYAVVLLAAAPFFVMRPRGRWLYGVSALACLTVVSWAERSERYSPYYAISSEPYESSEAVQILANGSLHQIAWPMGRLDPAIDRQHERHRLGLQMPAQLVRKPIRRALVLGAGTGNDVAALLEYGAEQVDAVEIDPVIVEMGRDLHPSRPYDSPRVRVFVTDARSFLNDSSDEYDLIVFGTLDSMTRLSALSSVRLDNFVYTREAIEAARARLAPEGGLALLFWVEYGYIHQYLQSMLTDVFDEPPALVADNFGMLNAIYLAGPGFAQVSPELRLPPLESSVDQPTDDWPYLYLPSHSVDPTYLSLIGILLVLGGVAVFGFSSQLREGLRTRGRADPEMFLYGFAFLLMETRYVTEMGLLWGASWLTSAVVFGSILVVILVGTVAMQLRPVSFRWAFIGLVASILITYVIPVDSLLSQNRPIRLALSVAYVGAPILFASICFALRFRIRLAPDIAFGWNLLGAVVGGFAELFSMSVGLKALMLAAVWAYLLSYYAGRFTPELLAEQEVDATA